MNLRLEDFELLEAVRDFALDHEHPAVQNFKAAVRDWGDGWIDIAPTHLPAADLLDSAIEQAIPETRGLLETFARHRQRLRWEQSYKKEDGVVPDAMLACYGFVEILGKQGPFVSERIRAGIGIYGPDIVYPAHRHHPEEIYIALAGSALFTVGEENDVAKSAGDVVYLKSNTPHGFRTGDEAFVIYYLWQGGDLREISSFD